MLSLFLGGIGLCYYIKLDYMKELKSLIKDSYKLYIDDKLMDGELLSTEDLMRYGLNRNIDVNDDTKEIIMEE